MNAFEESQHAQMVLLAEFSELEKRYLETVRMLEESQNGPEPTTESLPNETAFASELRELSPRNHSSKNESGICMSDKNIVDTIALNTSVERLNNSLSEGLLFLNLG